MKDIYNIVTHIQADEEPSTKFDCGQTDTLAHVWLAQTGGHVNGMKLTKLLTTMPDMDPQALAKAALRNRRKRNR